jgi:hypothetical protein
MHTFTIMAGLTSSRSKAEQTAEQIKALGFKPKIKELTCGFYAVQVLETTDEAAARAARDKIDQKLGVHTGLKIID